MACRRGSVAPASARRCTIQLSRLQLALHNLPHSSKHVDVLELMMGRSMLDGQLPSGLSAWAVPLARAGTSSRVAGVAGRVGSVGVRGSREGWANGYASFQEGIAEIPQRRNRPEKPHTCDLLRPSSRFSSSAFYPLLRHLLRLATTGHARQVGLARSTAYARPAGAVTASHWRCACDRSLCAPESRLWAVCREERPTGKCRSTCRSSALQR